MTSKSKCYLAIKTKKGLTHIEVPVEVYVYVKQLENAIRFESTRKILKEEYPNRF